MLEQGRIDIVQDLISPTYEVPSNISLVDNFLFRKLFRYFYFLIAPHNISFQK